MQTATVTVEGDHQTVRLPRDCHLPSTVAVRRQGEAVILEPIKPAHWPAGFFAEIQINDEAFQRPDQGTLPRIVEF
jgi:virulence-associated protein VagC